MKLSIILMLTQNKEDNQKTVSFLRNELSKTKEAVEILVYAPDGMKEPDGFSGNVKVTRCESERWDDEISVYSDAAGRVTGEYVTQMYGGDVWSGGALSQVFTQIRKHPKDSDIVMLHKFMPDGEEAPFGSDYLNSRSVLVENLANKYVCYPFYFGGTFLKASVFQKRSFHPELGLDAEREFFLSLCAEKKKVLYLAGAKYYNSQEREGDFVFYKGIYDPKAYEEAFTEFWMPFMDRLKETYGSVPRFIQYHFMFGVNCRIESNNNNKNKHVVDEAGGERCLRRMGECFQYLDDTVIFDGDKVMESNVADSLKWIYGILKYGEDFRFEKFFLAGRPYYGFGRTVFNKIENLSTTISFINYADGALEIDGLVHPILFSMADEVYFMLGNKKFALDYCERYAHTKTMGVSIYKSQAFHVSVPMDNCIGKHLFCLAKVGGIPIKITFNFNSHFSRMSGRFESSYWCFRHADESVMMIKSEQGLEFEKSSKGKKFRQEAKLQFEMFRVFRKKDWIFILIRDAYFFMKPFMKRKPIWMYLDKIYKGGDSSEYLYRYNKKRDKSIKHYYLLDKKTADYKRLKKDGFRPLKRGSIKHRLVFLMSDMMVISNSTVFAFNDFGMVNSSYIRDLIDFDVCCVQHGMSIQKIAVAQNRLRDNTRLYFCASKYELENLSRPIYDYQGYDALRLTGVPRYDGLVNDDKKQILISPTWRMQAAVPVRTNEGRQREYNPLFKESAYFKVYNSLINDPRLIGAAKKYGYKIKYVLHPIVSAQTEDFDKNDYVDIIPAVGDMSYERMFCESSLMVTDYSGIQFDFAYMRKPVVYLHHRDVPQHYEEGTFHYDTMGFGEICRDNDELIDLLCEYMADGCRMKEEYVRRADDFFYYDDRNNCERIYREMIKFKCGEREVDETVEERNRCAKKYLKLIKANNEPLGGKTMTDSYYQSQLDDKMIVMVGLGKNVRGNLQYILNELNSSVRFEGFKIYVRTSEETEKIVKKYIADNHWKRTRTATGWEEYVDALEKAKYLLTEVYFPEDWAKKPGQVYINIWHGTPLKKLGLAKNSKNHHKDGNTQRNFINADYLLYPNDYTREHMLASYKVADLMQGKAVMLGYPRTGGMIEAMNSDLSELRAQLAPNGEKLYAYMPTWKDYLKVEEVVEESKELLEYLDENMTDDQILYVNLHHKVSDSLEYGSFRHIRQFPPTVDSYKLLALTEALISDYSSVFYDYLALRKQIILYCADYELYEKRRGTYMDLMSLPFDKALSKEAVLEAMNTGKQYDDEEAYQTFCKYDSAENAKKLCSIFLGEEPKDVVVEPIPTPATKQILIYDESMTPSPSTKRLKGMMKQYDKSAMKIYIGCEMFLLNEHKKTAYPFLSNHPVIGTVQNPHLGRIGKAVLGLYQREKIDIKTAMEYLKYEYLLVVNRMFGCARFDAVLIYDVLDPERILALSLMEGEKYLFVNEAMAAKIQAGDRFFIDAAAYAAKEAKAVCVESEEIRQTVCGVLADKKDIKTIATVEDFAEYMQRLCEGKAAKR